MPNDYYIKHTDFLEAHADRLEERRDLSWRANPILRGIERLVLALLTAKAVYPRYRAGGLKQKLRDRSLGAYIRRRNIVQATISSLVTTVSSQ